MPRHQQDPYRRLLSLLPRNYWLLRAVVDGHLEPMGLSNAQWRPLLLLWEAPRPMTQVQIARALGMESPSLVRLLDRLAGKGWIARRNCPGDRRAYHVELTPSARALCTRIDRTLARLRAAILQDFAQPDLEQAIAIMERLYARLEVLEALGHSGQGKEGKASLRVAEGAQASNNMRATRRQRQPRLPPS